MTDISGSVSSTKVSSGESFDESDYLPLARVRKRLRTEPDEPLDTPSPESSTNVRKETNQAELAQDSEAGTAENRSEIDMRVGTDSDASIDIDRPSEKRTASPGEASAPKRHRVGEIKRNKTQKE